MPKVHFVKSARKAQPDHDINIGDSYYWWKFRYGGKRISKTRPRRSDLTQSSFLSQLYAFEDSYFFDRKDPQSCIQDAIDELNSMMDECQGNFENIPEQLQDTSDAGILLQERIYALEEWISNLESIDTDIDEGMTDEEKEEALDNMESEFDSANPGIE